MFPLTYAERQLMSSDGSDTIDSRVTCGRFSLDDLQRISYFNRKYVDSIRIRPAGCNFR